MRLRTSMAIAIAGMAAVIGLLAGPAGAQISGPNTSGGARATTDSVASGTCVAIDDSVCSGSGLAVDDSTSSGSATARRRLHQLRAAPPPSTPPPPRAAPARRPALAAPR